MPDYEGVTTMNVPHWHIITSNNAGQTYPMIFDSPTFAAAVAESAHCLGQTVSVRRCIASTCK
jgi:hypothetical protein